LVLLVYGSGTSDIKYRKYFDSDVKFVMFWKKWGRDETTKRRHEDRRH
jgi:hypothetical protein